MRTHRMLSILGLAVAVPMLIASIAFACGDSCKGDKAAAATASAQKADSKAGCAAKCTGAAAAAASSHCTGQATAAAAGASCAGKADAASAGASCAGKSTAAAGSCEAGAKHASCGADCNKACCAGKSAAMITYKVSGMTCMGCVKQVEAAVAKMDLENVESVTVSLDDNNAVVTTTGPVDAMAVAEAITKAGFQAEFAGAEKAAKADADKTEEPAATM
jgi:copper chaperone CopZ